MERDRDEEGKGTPGPKFQRGELFERSKSEAAYLGCSQAHTAGPWMLK